MSLCWDAAIYPFKKERITNRWYFGEEIPRWERAEFSMEATP
jgi:hypothetical protein